MCTVERYDLLDLQILGLPKQIKSRARGVEGTVAGRFDGQLSLKHTHARVPAVHIGLGEGKSEHIGSFHMCRNIRTLFNFEPPVTDEEIHAASLQFVRKISGFNKPSKVNEAAFLAAVDDVAKISGRLLASLESSARPRNREEEAVRAKARAAQRFGR